MSASQKRAMARVIRAIVLPALLVMLDAIIGYLQAGRLDIDWKVVAVAGVTAIAMGLSKWIRDELGADLKVV